jgi:glycosyltransferase involved in cell wall biosynthesis
LSVCDVEVLLPVHNEGPNIEATIRGIYEELSAYLNVGFIICEDGSRDDSKDVLRRLANALPIRLNLSDARKGYSKAMRDGIVMLEAEYLLCMDSDGQCDPKDFATFWRHRDTADILIGWRKERADSPVRRIFSRLFYLLYQLVFWTPVHDPSCPYVLVRKSVAQRLGGELGDMQEGFWWEFVARAHRRRFTIRELLVNHRMRSVGITQVYKWHKMPGIFLRHVVAIFKVWNETRSVA